MRANRVSSDEPSNLQQQVFDAFPAHPGIVTLDSLVRSLPYPKESIRKAVKRMREDLGIVEFAPPNTCCVYRLVKGAKRPLDMRGQHGNSGRKPKAIA